MVNLISSPETTKKLADKIAPKVERKNLFGITAEQASTIGKNMNISVKTLLQHAVFAKDVTMLIDKIHEYRQINPNDALIRVGLDGGG